MKISEHFDSDEFACRCGCGDSEVSKKLVDALEVIRKTVGKPLKINSGKRCAKHNKSVGGVKDSQHKIGLAADINAEGMTPIQLHRVVESLHTDGMVHIGGLGLYSSFVHVDVRAGTARWCG